MDPTDLVGGMQARSGPRLVPCIGGPAALGGPITTVIPHNASRQFAIYVGSDPVFVDGRVAAVDEAKEISRRTARPIRVERADGRVRMEFRRGALESYRFETRDRRS